jgi:putative ABC transport system permease protein
MYMPLILAGRWLQPGDDNAIVISKETADDHHFEVGDIVTLDVGDLGNARWQVVGIFQATYDIRVVPNPVYAPLEAVYQVTKEYHHGNRLFVQTCLDNEADQRKYAKRLQALYEDRCLDINPIITTTTVQDKQNAKQQFNIAIAYLTVLATIVAVVGGIGLMGTLSISVIERTREIGVMRSIGASSAQIMAMFMLEGILQGVLSWVIAIPISYLAAQPIARRLGQIMLSIDLEYSYDLNAVLSWLILVVLIAGLASLVPARYATQISVRKSLAYGG